MKQIKKQKRHAFGKDIYLLGVDKYGQKRWLEAPSWDCGWYWGFGYVESYTNNNNPERARDINEHTHFDSLFLNGRNEKHLYYDSAWEDLFVESTLDEKEVWTLMELMKEYYLLRESASLFGNGTCHITSSGIERIDKSDWAKEINEVMIPTITSKVLSMLSE